jgi:hypothetical protein
VVGHQRSLRPEDGNSMDFWNVDILPQRNPGDRYFKYVRGCIQKFPYRVDNEINKNNKNSLRSNTKGYGGKSH